MRLNSQTVHYFHTYAVKDRICFSHLSTDPIEIVQDSINFEMFYPTVGDNTQLVSNLETLNLVASTTYSWSAKFVG